MYKTLSIIIPVYNEEKTIVDLLNCIDSTPMMLEKEVVIVNDGSTDKSAKLIQNWIKERKAVYRVNYLEKENGGKGSAVRCGIENSTGDIVIIQDADLEYDPSEIDLCVKPIVDCKTKVVYGSRSLYAHGRGYSYLRYFIGGVTVTNWINLLFGTELTDEPTCYKTYDGDLIRAILFDGDGFEWEPEITCKLIRLGFEIHEIGISYAPRSFEEGKKINAIDGLHALWTSLYWRFASIKNEKKKLRLGVSDEYLNYRKPKLYFWVIALLLIAMIARLFVLLPGINNPEENYFRPDSSTYVQPAKVLAETGRYKFSVDADKGYAYRTPGYPAYLALFFKFTDNLKWSVIFMVILSALTCIPIFYSGCYFGGKWVGFIAGLFFALNITSIAHAPLILSDTLFTLIVTVQLWYFIKFYFSARPLFLFMSVIAASITVYIRPVELLWIFPCIFLVFIYRGFYLKKKLVITLLLVLTFFLPLMPWMLRNLMNDSGFTMSTDTGNLLYNNGAVLLGKVEGRSPEGIRAEMHEKSNRIFNKNPIKFRSEASRSAYEQNQLKQLILKYPLTYLQLSLRPWVLLPDLPTFCQDIGVGASGRGTFDVLNTQGIFAAVNHYFGDKKWMIYAAAPLLAVVLIMYICCFCQFVLWLCKKKWFLCFSALAFIEYFLLLPGPIAMPRYQIPALPMICIMAAAFISTLFTGINAKLNN